MDPAPVEVEVDDVEVWLAALAVALEILLVAEDAAAFATLEMLDAAFIAELLANPVAVAATELKDAISLDAAFNPELIATPAMLVPDEKAPPA
jgi:hypothetical protein